MYFFTIKLITILSLILITIDVIHTFIDPTIAMCIDGEIDTAFLTKEGITYLFMGSYFWKLKPDLSGVDGNTSVISDHWRGLSNNIETSIYVSGDKTNSLNGKTIFIKDKKWFSFINQEFDGMGSTDNWTDLPKGQLLSISQHNDPIVVFFIKHFRSSAVKAFYFDSLYFPENKDVLYYEIPFNTYETEAVVSYPDGKYLIFYDDNRVGGHCIMSNANSGCVTNRLNSDLFECPDYTKNIFNRNIFIKIWYMSGLGLRQFAIITLGILITISLFFIFFIFVMSLKIRRQCLKKCKKSKK